MRMQKFLVKILSFNSNDCLLSTTHEEKCQKKKQSNTSNAVDAHKNAYSWELRQTTKIGLLIEERLVIQLTMIWIG